MTAGGGFTTGAAAVGLAVLLHAQEISLVRMGPWQNAEGVAKHQRGHLTALQQVATQVPSGLGALVRSAVQATQYWQWQVPSMLCPAGRQPQRHG